MKNQTTGLVVLSLALGLGWSVTVGCGAKAPSPPESPLGGPINSGGTPDLNRSHGTVGPGGDPNTDGAPSMNKMNSGGTPDVSKTNTEGGPTIGGKDGGK